MNIQTSKPLRFLASANADTPCRFASESFPPSLRAKFLEQIQNNLRMQWPGESKHCCKLANANGFANEMAIISLRKFLAKGAFQPRLRHYWALSACAIVLDLSNVPRKQPNATQ